MYPLYDALSDKHSKMLQHLTCRMAQELAFTESAGAYMFSARQILLLGFQANQDSVHASMSSHSVHQERSQLQLQSCVCGSFSIILNPSCHPVLDDIFAHHLIFLVWFLLAFCLYISLLIALPVFVVFAYRFSLLFCFSFLFG